MKSFLIATFFSGLFLFSSCSQLASSFRSANPDTTENNIPKIYSLIENKKLKDALALFQEGMGKTGGRDKYDTTYGISFYDKKGNPKFINDYTFQEEGDDSSHKRFISGLSKIQSCLAKDIGEIDSCLKSILSQVKRWDLIHYGYPTGMSYDPSEDNTKNDIKFGLKGLKLNICGKRYVFEQFQPMGNSYTNVDHEWGGPLTNFLFNSSYTDQLKSLKTIRSSSYCK
jgi:hypothetical protein